MAKEGDFDFYCEEALSGKTKVEKVYESEKVVAFHHTKPAYKTHIVIIPKEHIHDVLHLHEEHNDVLLEMVSVAKQITADMDYEEHGVRLLTNIGAYQDTPHLHFHLVSEGVVK